MGTFAFERHGKNNVLPFNPEEESFMYAECKCAYVKFKKVDGNKEWHMNFYYKSDNKYIQLLVLERDGSVVRQRDNKIIQKYPSNQEELRSIISEDVYGEQ